MKKILLLIAVTSVLLGTISCGDDNDEPRRGNGVFTVNTTMFNHMSRGNNALGISTTQNKLVIDTVNHTASLELNYNDGTARTVSLKDISAKPKRLGFYELTASPTSQVTAFKGYVDFNEGAMRYGYTTADGIRVISMTPEVFFLKTNSTVTYDDTTKATTGWENAMYQFNISPATQTATVMVMQIVHAKDLKYFNNITSNNVPFTVTPDGFTISGTDLKTTAKYRAYVDTTNSVVATTDKYPFKTFNATIDLANDKLDADFMMGGSATVKATGRTYPDYTSY